MCMLDLITVKILLGLVSILGIPSLLQLPVMHSSFEESTSGSSNFTHVDVDLGAGFGVEFSFGSVKEDVSAREDVGMGWLMSMGGRGGGIRGKEGGCRGEQFRQATILHGQSCMAMAMVGEECADRDMETMMMEMRRSWIFKQYLFA